MTDLTIEKVANGFIVTTPFRKEVYTTLAGVLERAVIVLSTCDFTQAGLADVRRKIEEMLS